MMFCSKGSAASLAGVVALSVASCSPGFCAAPPTAYLQDSTAVGSGNTLSVTRVPVVVNGQAQYDDISILFQVDGSGTVTLAPGYPIITPSPTLETANFVAGTYNAAGNAKDNTTTVSGPGATDGGATEWSLAAPNLDSSTLIATATWYVGPLSSSPLAGRVMKAKITSTAYSFGVSGGGYQFHNGDLLGFAQTGNAITILDFTNNAGKDQSTPYTQGTYTLATH